MTRHPKRPKRKDRSCVTRKVRYQQSIDAKIALMRSQRFDNGKNPLRIYYCKLCNGFHMTSQPYNPKKRI